jgi:hypothetical protein
MLGWMSYEITGHKVGLEGAMRFASRALRGRYWHHYRQPERRVV